MSNFKWTRELDALPCSDPNSSKILLAPGETRAIFSGARSLSQDGTTQYSISLKPLTSNTYILTAVGGANPNFRTPRTVGLLRTSTVVVSQNGPLSIYTSSDFALTGNIQVGDTLNVGPDMGFNVNNVGQFKVLSFTNNSLTVENEVAVAESVAIGSNFAEFQVYSGAGVQIGDTLDITGGFSVVTQGSYQITNVYAESLEFYSTAVLPAENPITTQVAIYYEAKKLLYIEADQNCSLNINGSAAGNISPLVVNNCVNPGIFLRTDIMYSLSITNNGTSPANVFLASVE